ncbi:hypothetical protein ACFLTE_10420 [Bacteroidota bacterium]
MNIKEEYKNEIKNIIDILGKAKLFFLDTLYLSNPKTKKEQSIISKNRVLHEIRYALWVLTVLELCKLFDDNENHCYNLFKFVRKIRQDKNKSIFKDNLKIDTLDKWERKLQNLYASDTIDRLKDLRDKYYAHSDRTSELLPEELTPNDQSVKELIKIGEEIVYDFQGEIFDIDQDFEVPIIAGNILDDLIELNEYREKYE